MVVFFSYINFGEMKLWMNGWMNIQTSHYRFRNKLPSSFLSKVSCAH